MNDESSLYEQIKAIDSMITYIETTLRDDINGINASVDSAAVFFRQHGRTDLADEHLRPIMDKIIKLLDELMEKLNKDDLDYLYRVKERLNRALNRN